MTNKVSKNLELRRALAEALKEGRYLITITYVKGHKLEHYLTYQRFPDEDLLPTFDHFAGKILINETESDLETSTESRGHIESNEGRSGPKGDVLELDDRREDTVPGDLGEQSEPDKS